MENYEKMVRENKERSQCKVEKAITAIKKMFNDEEQVVVSALVKKTGLSRGFFYNNEEVHNELVRIQGLQAGKSFVAPQKVVINKAMSRENELLKKRLEDKDKEIAELREELNKYKKMAETNVLNTLKEL